MNKTQLATANINNLISFWELTGFTNITPQLKKTNHWPDRLWYEYGYTPDLHDLTSLQPLFNEDKTSLKFPVWDNNAALLSLLNQAGFEEMYRQTAMFLPLADAHQVKADKLIFKIIETGKEAEIWTDIASASFGYSIDTSIIKTALNHPSLQFIQAYNESRKPVGTTLLVIEPKLIGIHMMGVSPDHRRQNIARKIMHYIIALGLKSNKRHLTLQASPMGKPLYQSLGFIEQFTYPTYFRK